MRGREAAVPHLSQGKEDQHKLWCRTKVWSQSSVCLSEHPWSGISPVCTLFFSKSEEQMVGQRLMCGGSRQRSNRIWCVPCFSPTHICCSEQLQPRPVSELFNRLLVATLSQLFLSNSQMEKVQLCFPGQYYFLRKLLKPR